MASWPTSTGNTIIINIGSRGGVHLGDVLQVARVTKVVKDPVTGKPLRSVADTIGQLHITSVDEDSAVGTFSGSGPARVGDMVKNAQ